VANGKVRKWWIALGLIGAIGSGVFFWTYSQRERLQKLAIDRIIREIQPHLPVQIVAWSVDADWQSFRSGNLRRLDLTLREPRTGATAKLSGPLQVDLPGTTVKASYQGTLEVAHPQIHLSTDFDCSIEALSDFKKLGIAPQAIEFETKKTQITTPKIALQWGAANLRAEWTPEQATAKLNLDSLGWSDAFAAKKTTITWNWSAQKSLSSEIELSTPELLWGNLYLDPKSIQLQTSTDLSKEDLQTLAEIKVNDYGIFAEISARTSKLKSGNTLDSVSGQFKLHPLPISKIFPKVLALPQAAQLQDWEILSGTVEGSSPFQFPLSANHSLDSLVTRALTQLQGQIKNLSGRSLPLQADFAGLQARIQQETLTLQIDRIGYKKLWTQIPVIRWKWRDPQTNVAIQKITWNPIGLQLGPTQVLLKESSLRTEIQLPEIPLQTVAQSLCMDTKDFPLHLQIQRAPLSVDQGNLRGPIRLEADAFDGKIIAQLNRGFEIDRAVPEWHGEVDIQDLELKKIGEWLGFGKMQGHLEGHIHQGVWAGTYPTRMDLEIRAVPSTGRDIVFSPEAMKNFVKLFAGDELDAIPGIAQWMAFGWPSSIFGGYDVDYLGLQVESRDGVLAIRTLDPPEIFKREQKPYILYGPRFKMPLQVKQLPLITDATAMANFFTRLTRQIEGMIAAKRSENPLQSPQENSYEKCQPDSHSLFLRNTR
jgi:hypothetical protein